MVTQPVTLPRERGLKQFLTWHGAGSAGEPGAPISTRCSKGLAMIRLTATLLLLALALPLSGCIIAPARPGWCYYHPYKCR